MNKGFKENIEEALNKDFKKSIKKAYENDTTDWTKIEKVNGLAGSVDEIHMFDDDGNIAAIAEQLRPGCWCLELEYTLDEMPDGYYKTLTYLGRREYANTMQEAYETLANALSQCGKTLGYYTVNCWAD